MRGDAVLRVRLERALARLPVGYRTVIVLHDVEGLEHEEVAQILAATSAPRSRSCTRRAAGCARCWPPTASPRRRWRTVENEPRCKTYTTERLSAFFDGDLPPAEAAAVRAHAATCAACTATLADLRALVTDARALEVPEPPPTLWPSIEGALDRRERFAWLWFRPGGRSRSARWRARSRWCW